MKQSYIKVYSALILSMIFWSLSFVWYKEIYLYLLPLSTIFMRLVLSSIFLFTFCILTGKLQKIPKVDYKLFILLAFFEPFMYFMGESFGMKYVSSTVGAVIISTIPLFTPVMSRFVFKERISKMNLFGILISFSGVLLVVLKDDLTLSAGPLGITLLLIAVLAAVGYTAIILKMAQKYNTYTIITIQNAIGVFMFLPFFLIFEGRHFIHVDFSVKVFIPLVELAFFASSLAFILFTYGIRQLGATKANMFTNTIPVFTAIFAAIILGDPLSLQIMMGIIVVIMGILLSQIGRMKNLYLQRK